MLSFLGRRFDLEPSCRPRRWTLPSRISIKSTPSQKIILQPRAQPGDHYRANALHGNKDSACAFELAFHFALEAYSPAIAVDPFAIAPRQIIKAPPKGMCPSICFVPFFANKGR
jgi:hypothetical protein